MRITNFFPLKHCSFNKISVKRAVQLRILCGYIFIHSLLIPFTMVKKCKVTALKVP